MTCRAVWLAGSLPCQLTVCGEGEVWEREGWGVKLTRRKWRSRHCRTGFSKITQSHSWLSVKMQMQSHPVSLFYFLCPSPAPPPPSPPPCLSHCNKAEYLFPPPQRSGLLKGVRDRAHIRQHVCVSVCATVRACAHARGYVRARRLPISHPHSAAV